MTVEDLKAPFIELARVFGKDYDNWQERNISLSISRKQADEINKMFYDLIIFNNSLGMDIKNSLSDYTEMTIPLLGNLKFKIKD